MKLYWLIICLTTLSLVNARRDCHTSDVDLCVMPTVLKISRSRIPQTSEDLEKLCEIANKSFNCVEDFLHMCFADWHQQLINLVLEDELHVFKELCQVESELQTEFLKIAPCLSVAFNNTLHVCFENFERVVNQVTGENIEARIPSGCCYFNKFYDCTFDQVDGSCGKESFSTFKKLLHMLGLHWANDLCSSYNPSSKFCINMLNREVTPSPNYSYLARFLIIIFKSFL
ncbi:uncharacterized protein [Centruroides vittatus]|uniref:uncharacterized protein n=1 Tax=Centruroides vittatus TaxID=120091 RepID=UPI00350FD31A